MPLVAKIVAMLALAASVALSSGVRSSPAPESSDMQLGNFSVSLAVKDIAASRSFYEKLGFREVGGVQAQGWLILQNGTTKIGLFQGMFERNLLTFNPGWDDNGEGLESFQDLRELQALLKEREVELTTEADPESTGPANFTLIDPDGNPILIDQHVPRPER